MLAVPVLYCKILSSWPFIVLDTDPSWSDQAQAVVCGWALLARLFTPQPSYALYYLLIPKMIYKNTFSSSEDMHLAVIALSHWLLTVYYAFGQTGIVHFIELEFVWNYCRLLGIRYQLVQLGGFWPEARKCHTSHKYRPPPFSQAQNFTTCLHSNNISNWLLLLNYSHLFSWQANSCKHVCCI